MNKQILGMIGWIAGAAVWAFMAWNSFSEGKVGFAWVQVALAAWFLINAATRRLKNKDE